MMRMTQGWTGLRSAVVALGLLAWFAPGVEASATTAAGTTSTDGLMSYNTSGNVIDSTGVSGPNVLSFISVSSASSDPSSNVDLGYFKVAPNPQGVTTTYTNTPFNIAFAPQQYNGSTLTNPGTVTISGVVNGQVNGASQSNLVATFNSVGSGAFSLSGSTPDSTLSMLQNQKLLLVPSTTGLTSLTPGGLTSVEANVVSSATAGEVPAPEPSTIALFVSTILGLGLRKYTQGRRRPGRA
jgi:hypothetical protein